MTAALQVERPSAVEAERDDTRTNTEAMILGSVCTFMLRSPSHRLLPVAALEWLVAPAIKLGQLQLLRASGSLIGYASWAFVSEDVHAKLLAAKELRLEPGEWSSGTNAWLVDLVAPVDQMPRIRRQLLDRVFKSQPVHTMIPDIKNGKVIGFRPKLWSVDE